MVSDFDGVVEFILKLRGNERHFLEKGEDHLVEKAQILIGHTQLLIFQIKMERCLFEFHLALFSVLGLKLIIESLVPLKVLRKGFATGTEVGGVDDHF
jgi:hypothetical protein